MKQFLLLIFLTSAFNALANHTDTIAPKKNRIFLRLYDANGKKIADGKFVASTDSTLQLVKNRKNNTIPIMVINAIKPKHGGGYSILVGVASGMAVGTVALVIGGVGQAKAPDGQSEIALDMGIVSVIAPIVGGIGGSVAEIFRNANNTYFIHGNTAEWRVLKKQLAL